MRAKAGGGLFIPYEIIRCLGPGLLGNPGTVQPAGRLFGALQMAGMETSMTGRHRLRSLRG